MEQEKQTYKIKIIPEFISGSSTHAVIKQQALKTLKKFQGLSNFTTTHGFTLIELLVVVLIIGILAAVALPQYQFAVYKSRYALLKNLVHSIDKAEETYFLANGNFARNLNQLDISLCTSPNTMCTFDWGHCQIASNDNLTNIYIECRNSQMGLTYRLYPKHNTTWIPGQRVCVVPVNSNSLQNKLCKAETTADVHSDKQSYYYSNSSPI